MNFFQEPSMVFSPIAQTVIKFSSQKNHERKASTTVGSPCLGSDRRGPHPIVLSNQDRCLFCPGRYEYSPAVEMPSWDEKKITESGPRFSRQKLHQSNYSASELFV
jgi:hypothetical protein